MKKTIVFMSVLFMSIFLTGLNAFCENIPWQNPKAITTYIEPGCRHSELMGKAFAYWSQVTNNKIIFKYVNSPDKAQIAVRFVKDASKTSQMEHALGVTYPKFQMMCLGDDCKKFMYHADIEIAERAPNGGLLHADGVYRIMIHEIGHAIGILDHSNDPMSVMYPTKHNRNQALVKSDFETLNKLYGW